MLNDPLVVPTAVGNRWIVTVHVAPPGRPAHVFAVTRKAGGETVVVSAPLPAVLRFLTVMT